MVSIVAFQAVDRGSIPRWRRDNFTPLTFKVFFDEKIRPSFIKNNGH